MPERLAASAVSHQVGFGRKSFEVLYGTQQEESAVLPKQMKLKLSEFLPITISGRSESTAKEVRKGKGWRGKGFMAESWKLALKGPY